MTEDQKQKARERAQARRELARKLPPTILRGPGCGVYLIAGDAHKIDLRITDGRKAFIWPSDDLRRFREFIRGLVIRYNYLVQEMEANKIPAMKVLKEEGQ